MKLNLKTYYVNNKKYTVEDIKNPTILDICSILEYNIPRFCYHPKLSVAGNCRMCLVDVEGSPKPVASCSMPLMNSMRIYTNTARVKKAREGVLEFLLANHPLDCPICDQGGECDLQDQAIIFGGDKGRFYENKRAIEDKNCGPLIKTLMTRCIHCTRCIRFYTEVAGVPEFGTTGRGFNMEVGTYISKVLTSELSGNIIDLCPVGALTSKPYAFIARSWELSSIESIDVLDATCSKIRVDVKGNSIMRILPTISKTIAESWISDKVRFSYDGLQKQRLSSPMILKKDIFIKVSWLESLLYINYIVKRSLKYLNSPKGALYMVPNYNNLIDVESLFLVKHLFTHCGYNYNINNTHNSMSDIRSNYLFNITTSELKKVDTLLLIGINPRLEAPLINIELRKLFIKKKLLIFSVGASVNLTYNIQHIGATSQTLIKVLKGKHWISQYLLKAKYPIIIKGHSLLQGESINSNIVSIISSLKNYIKKLQYNQINMLISNVGTINMLDFGITNKQSTQQGYITNLKKKFKFLVNYSFNNFENSNNSLNIYQGHHGSQNIIKADVLLPTTTSMEKVGKYNNIFGEVATTSCVVYPLKNIRTDWKILNVLNELLNNKLFFNSIKDLNLQLSTYTPHYKLNTKITKQYRYNYYDIMGKIQRQTDFVMKFLKVKNFVLLPVINNFYQNDIITKASYTMSLCTQKFGKRKKNFI